MRRNHLAATATAGVLACLAVPMTAKPLELVIPPKGGLRAGNQGTRHLIPLEGFGSNPNAMYRPLKLCQGDCDEDSDCKGDLVCFQRDPGDPVPGCEGGEEAMSKTDYCIEKEESHDSPSHEETEAEGDNNMNGQQRTSSAEYKIAIQVDNSEIQEDSVSTEDEPADAPREKNASVQRKSSEATGGLPVLTGYGSSPDQMLNECEGDCDEDSDCQGDLVCFQRDIGEGVPGCEGVSRSKSDYCVKDVQKSNFAGASDRNDGNSESNQYVFTTGDEFSSAAVGEEPDSEQESDPLQNKLIVAAIISAAVLLAVCLTCVTCRFMRARNKKCCLKK